MVRIAHERIDDLFALAAREARGDRPELANRYVELARRVGTRYNVRLPPEYRELYCRGCSTFWVEGRTVRTRLRAGHRVRTCLACGRERRTATRTVTLARPSAEWEGPGRAGRDDGALVAPAEADDASDEESEEG